jgi:hypothetical protein
MEVTRMEFQTTLKPIFEIAVIKHTVPRTRVTWIFAGTNEIMKTIAARFMGL